MILGLDHEWNALLVLPHSSQVICMSDFSSHIDIVAQNLIMGMSQIKTRLKTIQCAAVGVASHQHRPEACTTYSRSGSMSNKTGVLCIM